MLTKEAILEALQYSYVNLPIFSCMMSVLGTDELNGL